MASEGDGFVLLKAIADASDLFPDIRAEAAKTGRALVAKQLKAKTLPLSGLRRIHDRLGEGTFKLVAAELKEAEVKSLVTRLDRDNATLKMADKEERLRRLLGLAAGAEPAVKAAKPAKEKPAKAPRRTPKRALGSAAFTATWDGKDHDAPGKKKT